MNTAILDQLIEGLKAADIFDLDDFIICRADAAADRLVKTGKYEEVSSCYCATSDALDKTLSEEQYALSFAMDDAMGNMQAMTAETCYRAGLMEGIMIYHIFRKALREGAPLL